MVHHPKIVLLFASTLLCSIISYTYILNLVHQHHNSSLSLPIDIIDIDAPSNQQPIVDEADFIIRKSYSESYGRMFTCPDGIIEKDCIAKVVENIKKQQQSSQNKTASTYNEEVHQNAQPSQHPYPWWFTTLLRDIPSNGAYGFWHHFSTVSTNTTPIKFCAIGKNGSTEWRKVFKALTKPEYCNNDDVKKCDGKFNTAQKLSDDVPQTVFIRDPLERLLSAYLDKCVKPNVRVSQGHCEPNEVFGTDFLERKYNKLQKKEQQQKGQQQNGKAQYRQATLDLTHVLQDKEMFAAYVDLLPLKWNVHFVPQAIFCDLYRNIDNYDVYKMGTDFMPELDRMANKYGGMLPQILDDTFQYQSKLTNESSITNLGTDKAHGTKAPSKVSKYYSSRAVRRALEYLSIDYVTLGLEVPIWAREMLYKD